VGSPWLETFGTVSGLMFLLRGRGRIGDLLRAGEQAAAGFGRTIRADYLADAAALLAQRGDAEGALTVVADVVAIAQELGYKQYISEWINGAVLVDAGRPAEAIEPLETAAATAREAGDLGSASSIIGLLARALALTGNVDEAARRSAEARALTTPSDRWSALLWRGAAVRICAAQGRPAEARALADELVALLADIDYPGIEFHARLDAAEGYRASGDPAAAEALLRRAAADSGERDASGFARQAAAALERVRADAATAARTRSTAP
jgi:tetratricopeptide (TPR) repeat protein